MKKLMLIFAFLGLFGLSHAQAPIVLQSGDAIFVHSRLDTIVKHATNGSMVYLPGGNVLLSAELLIDKELHIIGAGCYPDSSAATSVTMISGANIRFTGSGSRSSMTGVYVYNDIYFGKTAEDKVSFIDISRCNLANVYLGYSNSRNTQNSNFRFSENVIRGNVQSADAQYCLFEKNIIDGQCQHFAGNASFLNNVFNFYSYSYDVFYISRGVIANNNIFCRDNHGLSGSQINNNLFAINHPEIPSGGENLGSNNIGNQPPATIFVNFNGTSFVDTFDLHLKEGCPGIGAGTDGTDIGIYGTISPYKPSAVPHNPHIRYVKIGEKSINGKLPVEIKVGAQQN